MAQGPRAPSETPRRSETLRRVFLELGSRSDVQCYPGSRVITSVLFPPGSRGSAPLTTTNLTNPNQNLTNPHPTSSNFNSFLLHFDYLHVKERFVLRVRSGPTTGGAEGFDRQPSSTGMMNDWIINAQLPHWQNIGGTTSSPTFLLNPAMGHELLRAPAVMWRVL